MAVRMLLTELKLFSLSGFFYRKLKQYQPSTRGILSVGSSTRVYPDMQTNVEVLT